MGLVFAPSGTGKSETAMEYKTQNTDSVLVLMDIATRRVGVVLRLVTKKMGKTPFGSNSISELLNAAVDNFKNSHRLLIIDDAHFLTWEAFEAIRKIHDAAGIGVVFLGQERLYDQMRGATNQAFLFDQIYSRIGIKRGNFPVIRQDVKDIAESILPGLDKTNIDFLFEKAQGQGRFRMVSNILELALKIHEEHGRDINGGLLQEASTFLMI